MTATTRAKVVFRVWDEGATDPGYDPVFALMPEMDEGRGLCNSYAHVGQHSSANYQGCIDNSRPATPEEYAHLLRELEGIGYELEVVEA